MCICRAGENDLAVTLDFDSKWLRDGRWIVMDDIHAPEPPDAEEKRASVIELYKRMLKKGGANGMAS